MTTHSADDRTAVGVPAVGSARILGRAILRRCPHCGAPGIFAGYLVHRDRCPRCRLRLDRGEGDFFIGAYTINLIAAELIVFFLGVAVLLARWPDVPWSLLMWGLMVLMVVAPVVLYPFSRQLWLGLDLLFRPAEPADFSSDDVSRRPAQPSPHVSDATGPDAG
ncbi:hypothetical protein BH23GEM9_BH23GEM9_04280 [soil metagenome]